MKKLIIALIVSMSMAATTHAEWSVDLAAGQFFDKNEDPIASAMNFALIVDMKGNGFTSYEAKAGDSFVRESFTNASEDYMTLTTGSLSDADGEGFFFAYSNSTFVFDNVDYGFAGDEEVALVVWDSASSTLSDGDNYVVVTPSLAGNDLSGGNKWIIPTSNEDTWAWYFLTQSVEGTIDNSYGTLSQTAVPEPSTYAVIFGAIALGFVAYRRRK